MCSHYWIFESPNGEKSRGVCKLCGVVCEANNCIRDDNTHPHYNLASTMPPWWQSENPIDKILVGGYKRNSLQDNAKL